MSKKLIAQDFVGVWLLLTGCLIGGLAINEMRAEPLPLVYSSAESRINYALDELGTRTAVPIPLEGDVEQDEMRKISSDHLALILDARPKIFYRLGHIPSAISLPRDDFEKQYQASQSILQTRRNLPLVVYCSSSECLDSKMVAEALQKLGYRHIRLFRGGWSDWESAKLPEEKE